jgi:hypothetical protein
MPADPRAALRLQEESERTQGGRAADSTGKNEGRPRGGQVSGMAGWSRDCAA